MKRKILTLGMATIMAASTAMIAMAEDPSAATQAAKDATIETADASGAYGQQTEITGSTATPTIKVTVPTVGDVAVNPYKMSYKLGESDAATDQVFSPEYTIKNESNVAISVGVTATGKVEGKAAFATASAAKATTNSVFAYVEFTNTTGTYESAYNAKNAKQIVLGTKAVTKTNVITLAKGDETAQTVNYKFLGDAASSPKTPWSKDDKIGATLAFTFTPIISAK